MRILLQNAAVVITKCVTYYKMHHYCKMLQNRDQYWDECFKGDLIIWSNKDITIEGKSLYWKTWSEHGVYFVQDLLNNIGKYLSYGEFKSKYNIEVNFIYYCQILSAIPKSLKSKAMTIKKPLETITRNHTCPILSSRYDSSMA